MKYKLSDIDIAVLANVFVCSSDRNSILEKPLPHWKNLEAMMPAPISVLVFSVFQFFQNVQFLLNLKCYWPFIVYISQNGKVKLYKNCIKSSACFRCDLSCMSKEIWSTIVHYLLWILSFVFIMKNLNLVELQDSSEMKVIRIMKVLRSRIFCYCSCGCVWWLHFMLRAMVPF